MYACTFFGHRDTPSSIKIKLRDILIDLIENKNVSKFYVGNQGNFDSMVRLCLKSLKSLYPIEYTVVLAYIPGAKDEFDENTLIPDDIESVPPRFAIYHLK